MRSALLAAASFVLLTLAQAAAPLAAAGPVVARTDPDHLTLPPPRNGRARPLLVIVAENRGAETADFIVPYGVLKDSGVADVRSLSTAAGPVHLRGTLTIIADQTLAAFDAAEPGGADIVIVPAQAAPKDPRLAAWVRAQAAKGATIVSVCEGARVLANAGLLKGRSATTHWISLKGIGKTYPDTHWVSDRRYVQDGPIISTTGVTASIPMSLALVEGIGGRPAAEATALRFGVTSWRSAHRTADFALRKGDVSGALGAMAAVWTHETVEAPIADGVDEVALALRADAWESSLRTHVVTTAADPRPVRSRHGLLIVPDATAKRGRHVIAGAGGPAVAQLDSAIAEMGHRYGAAAVRRARLALEYDDPAELALR